MTAPFLGTAPTFDATNFIAETAIVLGDVTLGAHASIWYGASLRGDVHWIEIGAESNVQDNVTIHVSRGTHPCLIKERVTIGHNAVVHGAMVEPDCLIGMGAIVLDGAVIGAGSLVGAGAVVTPYTFVPPRSLVLGQPGRVVRVLSDAEVERTRANAAHYVRMSRMYLGQDAPAVNPFYSREANRG
ncbi:MAG: gamma carbonic anhydrase family protein [Bacteroidota bacterium]